MNRLADLTYEDWQVEALREKKRLRTLCGLLSGDAPKPPPLVHGLLPEQTLVLISAEPYTGKSLFCLDLALALATESPVLGRFAPRERRSVLFCGQDSPDWDYAEQVRKLARGRGLLPTEAEALSLDFWFNSGGDITDPSFLSSLEEWHMEHPVDVVMFDTLQAFHSADENSSREMGVVMTIAKRLRDRFRWTVVLTHHTAKPSSDGEERSLNYRARGSSVISGSIDVHLTFRAGKDGMVHVRMPKGRGADPIDRKLAFQIHEEELVDGTQLVRLAVPPQVDAVPELILRRLQQSPASRGELISAVKSEQPGCKATAVDNALALLKRAGKVLNPQRGVWICPKTPQ